ncbi:hypothetical protein FRB97_009139 [Tulasnella sp. 331]|nr:hypothetical protein FRB97_009139 [Tulasnella sp. 331]
MAAVSHPDESTETAPIEFGKQSPALLVAAGLEQATQRCREKVLRIAKECRSRNRRFRDIEFDIEEDKNDCLHSVDTAKDAKYYPADVLRVHEVFDKPRFFIGGPSSTDIAQGSCGDCWFLAALSTLSDTGLVEKICVERDEAVGVYGFIFFRDCGWVDVIIDDLLFTNSPKYEELTAREKKIYHEDKERYNRLARKGGYNLFFGQSTTENETWVPLIEKAYAKLHGDYQSLSGGFAAEAIEDLTGGVSHLIHSKDILDYEDFWSNVLQAEDRLFSCHIVQLNPERKGETPLNYVEGLCTLHAYSVLRAREVRGKRFVLLRNPWGSAQYSGPWSDGSMEWTSEWMDVLDVMGHKFGEGGQFLMEYHHFLSFFTIIEHSRLFNPSWTLTQEWVKATSRTWPCAFNHGDVSFTISVPRKTPAVIVLAKEDSRFFAAISGYSVWALDFVLYQRGRKEPQGTSQHAVYGGRSVHLEIELEAGDYVVHARLDQWLERQKDYYTTGVATWESRKLSRALAQRAASASIASNFNSSQVLIEHS